MDITWITADFAIGPQLQLDDVKRLADQGFRTIVNNRPDGEAADQPDSRGIEAEAKRLGLDYMHIPVVSGELTEAQARKLKEFLREARRPALAFCRTGKRSTSLWKLAEQVG